MRKVAVSVKQQAGRTLARLATVGVVDRDGDVIEPGALQNDPKAFDVPVSAYGHAVVLDGAAPVGVARVFEQEGALLAEVRWDDSDAGRAALERVTSEKSDFSWAYDVISAQPATPEQAAEGGRRDILELRITEVSPVAKGASVASGTLENCRGECQLAGAKSATCPGPCACAVRTNGERERVRLLKWEFERTVAHHAAAKDRHSDLRAIALAGEVAESDVAPVLRKAAVAGAELAAAILGGDVPRVRWLNRDTARRLKARGVWFEGDPGSIWLDAWPDAIPDADEAFETAAHETYHALKRDASEAAAGRFGQLLATLRGVELHIGARKDFADRWVARPYPQGPEFVGLDEGDVVVEDGVLYRRVEAGWEKVLQLA